MVALLKRLNLIFDESNLTGSIDYLFFKQSEKDSSRVIKFFRSFALFFKKELND